MKTIFITSFFGLIARNILATDFLRILSARSDLKIVIFAPREKKELYDKTFASSNVVIEGIPNQKVTRLESLISSIFLNASDTSARCIHRLIERQQDKKYVRFMFHWLLAKTSNFILFRRLLRYSDSRLSAGNRFRNYFEKYGPDLVFATDIFEPNDIDMSREAQSRGIYVLGMIRSWDNITTKGLNRIITDKLVVNTPTIKAEALRYCDFSRENVHVVGVPHYDAYTVGPRISKEDLFRNLKLDPNKKTVLFAAPSDIYVQGDTITSKVVGLLENLNVQVIVRLYVVGKVNLGNIRPIPNKLAVDDPGNGNDFIQAELIGKDAHLADLLYHSDVVVAFASTLAIDAVVFNKPVIFVGFDSEAGRPYWKSLRRFYDYDHQRSILNTRGIRLAKTPDDLIIYVNCYLENPDLDGMGRKKIIEERCWKLDGQSGKRLADIILKKLI